MPHRGLVKHEDLGVLISPLPMASICCFRRIRSWPFATPRSFKMGKMEKT